MSLTVEVGWVKQNQVCGLLVSGSREKKVEMRGGYAYELTSLLFNFSC
jgi:hypothetical protein